MSRRLTALAALLVALPAGAASLHERTVDIVLHGGGLRVTEVVVWAVEEVGDLATLSEHSVYLDDNVELTELEAVVLDGGGAVVERVRRRDCREVTSAGSGLHSSARRLVVPFPRLDIGQRLRLRTAREMRPYFPGYQVPLQLDVPQRTLQVKVVNGGEAFRWQAPFTDIGFNVSPFPGGIEITAQDVPRLKDLDHAAADDSGQALLRFTWGHNREWADVGRWYSGLVASVPRNAEAVQRLARELTAAVTDRSERLRIVTRHVQDRIRYEAVEVGIGGYVPHPAAVTLKRGWGDCKDMSELLAEMLRAIGIPAHLTLVRLGIGARVDADFPSVLQFNHCIVAVPEAGLKDGGAEAGAAAAADAGGAEGGGYLFLDPTMKEGGPTWLHASIQGQLAVVEAGADTRAVTIPRRPDLEGRALLVDGALNDAGTFTGLAALRLHGRDALGWLRRLSTDEAHETEAAARRRFELAFAGVRVGEVRWRRVESDVPTFHLEADLTIEHLASGSAQRVRFRPAMLNALPEPRTLDDRREPVVLVPRTDVSRWTVRLPAGLCPPAAERTETGNRLAKITQAVSTDTEGRLVIERTVRIDEAFVPAADFALLRELAIEETRTARRSVRLSCGQVPDDAPAVP